MSEAPLIALQHLSKVYERERTSVPALRQVDLLIARGALLAVVGQSGSGKSTLLNIIGCLDIPTQGRYLLDGVDTARLSDLELARIRNQSIGFVFQNFNLLPRYSALQNVSVPMIYAGTAAAERTRRAAELLTFVGLSDRMGHTPAELSGGQQQRVAIARAMANMPSIILADEPTGNLDTGAAAEIMEMFLRLHREQRTTVVLVTHDPEIAALCDGCVTLRDGRVQCYRKSQP